MRRRRSLIVLGLIFAFALAASAARAEAADDARGRPDGVTEGTLFWRTAEQESLVPAPTLKTDVSIVVTGIVARATVRQEFTNSSSAWAEGIYVFPLPEDAAVDHLRMKVGDRVIEGVIQESATAKAQYEQAKHEGRRASVVEQERPKIFSTSVAQIATCAALVSELEYVPTVRFEP